LSKIQYTKYFQGIVMLRVQNNVVLGRRMYATPFPHFVTRFFEATERQLQAQHGHAACVVALHALQVPLETAPEFRV